MIKTVASTWREKCSYYCPWTLSSCSSKLTFKCVIKMPHNPVPRSYRVTECTTAWPSKVGGYQTKCYQLAFLLVFGNHNCETVVYRGINREIKGFKLNLFSNLNRKYKCETFIHVIFGDM